MNTPTSFPLILQLNRVNRFRKPLPVSLHEIALIGVAAVMLTIAHHHQSAQLESPLHVQHASLPDTTLSVELY